MHPTLIDVISHRGWWREPDEKNTQAAFQRSFEAGFGTETDVRDLDGQLVISHDMPRAGAMGLDDFLDLFAAINPDLPLAMNIKADGLFDPLADAFAARDLTNWYAFDMSVPDMVQFQRRGLPFFTRQSDHEPEPALLSHADGIWVDEFNTPWLTRDILEDHVAAQRRLCLVSPELHGRAPAPVWETWKAWIVALCPKGTSRITLCTDLPDRAVEMFRVS